MEAPKTVLRTTLRGFPVLREVKLPLEIDVHGATHVGGRENNEDAFHAWKTGGMVADGIGGMAKGEVASGHVRKAFQANEARLVKNPGELVSVIEAAHKAIFSDPTIPFAMRGQGKAGGSTVASVAIDSKEGKAVVAHVGDSRVYRLRNNVLELLTVDHTFAQGLREQGIAEAFASQYDHVLERSLGSSSHEPDVKSVDVKPGDVFAIVSDGWKTLSEQQLKELLLKAASAKEAAEAIVRHADEAGKALGGGHDNITAVVLRVLERRKS